MWGRSWADYNLLTHPFTLKKEGSAHSTRDARTVRDCETNIWTAPAERSGDGAFTSTSIAHRNFGFLHSPTEPKRRRATLAAAVQRLLSRSRRHERGM